MRRRHHIFHAEQFIVLGRFDLEHVDAGARHLALFSAATRSASTMSPPRAQLMMRTPFFILAIAAASMMLRVLSVSGVCSVMKSARAKSSSNSTLSTPSSSARLSDRNGSKAMTCIFRPTPARGDDRADVAAADDAQRLAGISTPMKRFFSHLPHGSRHWLPGSGGRARRSSRPHVRRW